MPRRAGTGKTGGRRNGSRNLFNVIDSQIWDLAALRVLWDRGEIETETWHAINAYPRLKFGERFWEIASQRAFEYRDIKGRNQERFVFGHESTNGFKWASAERMKQVLDRCADYHDHDLVQQIESRIDLALMFARKISAEIEAFDDRDDIAAARASLAESDERIPYEQIRANLKLVD